MNHEAQAAYRRTLGSKAQCADVFQTGAVKWLPTSEALQRRHIMVPHEWRKHFLAFDIDRPGAMIAHEDVDLPAPTYVMVNPTNGHGHLLYQLESPVLVGQRSKPQEFYADVNVCLVHQLKADPGYVGRFCKTPGHQDWETICTGRLYSLGELLEYATVTSDQARREIEAARAANPDGSRHWALFNELRRWAYDRLSWFKQNADIDQFREAATEEAAKLCSTTIRLQIPGKRPLAANKQGYVVSSVVRWAWNKYDPTSRMSDDEFRKLQQARINKRWSGYASLRDEAIELHQSGMSKADISRKLGVHRNTVSAWLR